MYGDIAIDLLRELKRSNPKLIPAYNEDKIRQIIEEISALYDEVRQTLVQYKQDVNEPHVTGSMLAHHASITRNRRCLLAYLNERVSRLKVMRWEVGQSSLSDTVKPNLSKQEDVFVQEYGKLLAKYNEAVGLDLTADLKPPKDLLIEVRCLSDLGDVILPSGASATLQNGSQHYLARSDVEHLIRQGHLEHIVN